MRQVFFERHAGVATRRGVVALEFAILAVPLFILLLGIMELGYDFFVQAALDHAVHVAARSVQVGNSSGSASGANVAAWVTAAVCPALGVLLSCANLLVNVTAVPSGTGQNYFTYISANPPSLATMASTSNAVCTGTGGQLMLLRAYYLGPTFVGLLVPGWSQASPADSARRVHVTYAATGYVNEYFGTGQTGC